MAFEFKDFAKVLRENYKRIECESEYLFHLKISKDELWDFYIEAYPDEVNGVYKENRKYDCNTCKSFIRKVGNVVGFIDGKRVSIWDDVDEVGSYYKGVSISISEHLKQYIIDRPFHCDLAKAGVESNLSLDGVRFYHLNAEINPVFCNEIDHQAVTNRGSLERSASLISDEAIEFVEGLINDNELYRGREKRHIVDKIKEVKRSLSELTDPIDIDNYLWNKSMAFKGVSAIHNDVLGILLRDLSEGVLSQEKCVSRYDQFTAPANFKRTKRLVSPAEKKRAFERVTELGYANSLYRRSLKPEDIDINDVIFADNSVRQSMGAFDLLDEGTKSLKSPNVSNQDFREITIEEFITKVVPKSSEIFALTEEKLKGNFVSLIGPVYADSPHITRWSNNTSWSYNGEATDAFIRDTVKVSGGKVEGCVVRFSIVWNDGARPDTNDLDAHCRLPNAEVICWQNTEALNSTAFLDIDVITPRINVPAAENIVFTELSMMPDGEYEFSVDLFSDRGGLGGFRAEIELNGTSYRFDHECCTSRKTVVAIVTKKGKDFSVDTRLSTIDNSAYGVNGNDFVRVNMMLLSPNYWEREENKSGLKHFFFILEDCKAEHAVRGFYNEFLTEDLYADRAVFEHLTSKMVVEGSENQLAGYGFSENVNNSLKVKVKGKGKANGFYKIKFGEK